MFFNDLGDKMCVLFCGLSHEQAHAWKAYTQLTLGKDVRVIIIIDIRTTILVDPCADLQRAYSHLF